MEVVSTETVDLLSDSVIAASLFVYNTISTSRFLPHQRRKCRKFGKRDCNCVRALQIVDRYIDSIERRDSDYHVSDSVRPQ